MLILILCLALQVTFADSEGGTSGVKLNYDQSATERAKDLIANKGTGPITFEQPTELTLGNGQKIVVSGKVDFKDGNVAKADSIKYLDSEATQAEDFEATESGYKVAKAQRLVQGGNVITGGIGIKFENSKLSAEHADSFVTAGTVGTNVYGLEAESAAFSVGTADLVQSECVNVKNIIASDFRIFGNALEVSTQKGVNVSLTDCSFNEVTFESNEGKVLVNKQIPPVYFIENGSLVYRGMNYTEKLEANNSARVEMDPQFGFSCMSVRAVGTYWYNHNSMRKDFGVHVPADQFRLCLKKNPMQKYADYNGLIDFTQNEIFLSKIVEYLKYPFKNNQLASLLMTKLFEDKADYKAYMKMTHDFSLVDSLAIEGNNTNSNIENPNKEKNNISIPASINNEKTTANPNNYLELKEKTINDEVHRLAKINQTISKERLEDSRITVYQYQLF